MRCTTGIVYKHAYIQLFTKILVPYLEGPTLAPETTASLKVAVHSPGKAKLREQCLNSRLQTYQSMGQHDQ